MANRDELLALFSIAVLVLLSPAVFTDGMKVAASNVTSEQKTWCVAKPSTADADLGNIMEYVCSQEESGRHCWMIHPGGPCYLPNTTLNHASVAMNLYYQSNGKHVHECYFGGSGLIVTTNPSYGKCKFY